MKVGVKRRTKSQESHRGAKAGQDGAQAPSAPGSHDSPPWMVAMLPPLCLLPTSQPHSVLTAHCVPGCLEFLLSLATLPLDTP